MWDGWPAFKFLFSLFFPISESPNLTNIVQQRCKPQKLALLFVISVWSEFKCRESLTNILNIFFITYTGGIVDKHPE